MSALVEFLHARLNEADAEARRRGAAEHVCSAHHGDPFDPFHVLADVAAKRAIVQQAVDCNTAEIHVDAWVLSKIVLAHLATAYADHPDYRQEWKP